MDQVGSVHSSTQEQELPQPDYHGRERTLSDVRFQACKDRVVTLCGTETRKAAPDFSETASELRLSVSG